MIKIAELSRKFKEPNSNWVIGFPHKFAGVHGKLIEPRLVTIGLLEYLNINSYIIDGMVISSIEI